MSEQFPDFDDLVSEWMPLPDVADAIGETVSTLRLWAREGKLVVIGRGQPAIRCIPADLVHDGRLVRGLASALTVLADAGFDPEDSLKWLFIPDDALGGRPVDLMAEGRDVAVRRRAMMLAL